MKILWLVNIIMPELAEHLGRKSSVFGGWLIGAMNAAREAGHELVICATEPRADVLCSDVSGVRYYIVPSGSIGEMEAHFRAILQQETPDVVHIFGTEFEQCMAMANCADVERTVVQIQGAMTLLKDVVYAGLPARLCRDNPLHKLLRRLHKGGQSIDLQRQSFERRAAVEQQVLRRVKYIFGASEWGNAVAKSVNPNCITFDCNLILRDTFYTDDRWSPETCEPHSIYILFSYPIKGFHKFLEALPQILRQYPDTMVYVVANQLPIRHYTGIKRLIQDAAPDYNWLIQKQIEKNNLQGHLKFIGHLNAEQVKARMLKSNVFVSASAMENQSMTLGEAMILGVPSVASAVGAIPEMIDDGEDGFLYPFEEPKKLSDAVCKIFSDRDLALRFSEKGHSHAAATYDRERNGRNLIKMYETIANTAKERET